MHLIQSPTSPYARKVRILIKELGLEDKIPMSELNPMKNPDAARRVSPLGLVPVLTLEDENFIPDSPVIVDYIFAHSDKSPLHPDPESADYWADRKLHAISDGLTDICMRRTQENFRPEEERSASWLERWSKSILTSLDFLEENFEEIVEGPLSIGRIALITTLDYVDFRHGDLHWKADHPKLTDWQAEMHERASVQETAPSA